MNARTDSLSSNHPDSLWIRVLQAPLFAPILMAAVMAEECVTLILSARFRPFWYDELLTFDVSGLQPFQNFRRALEAGADGMPLGYYLFVRIARLIPAAPELTLRLPSIFGYLLALLGLYWFASKRLPAIAGLIAALLLAFSPFRNYAVEARGYALLVGFLAIAAALWQEIGEKKFRTPLLAIVLAMAVSCHPLAVVSLWAFAVAEMAWSLQFHSIRWGAWSSFAFACIPFLLNLPVLMHYKLIFGTSFWARPSFHSIQSSYEYYLGIAFPFSIVLIACLWIGIARALKLSWYFHKNESFDLIGFSELALIGGFLSYPVVLVVLTKIMHSGYVFRYAWPTIIGLDLAIIYLSKFVWFNKRVSRYILWAFLICLLVGNGLRVRAQLEVKDQLWASLAEVGRSQPNLPILVGSGVIYLEALRYGPPELRDRLVEVADPGAAAALTGIDTTDRTNRILGQYVPLHLKSLAEFEKRYPKFIFLSGGGREEWMSQYLLQKKYNLELLADDARLRSDHSDANIYLAQH